MKHTTSNEVYPLYQPCTIGASIDCVAGCAAPRPVREQVRVRERFNLPDGIFCFFLDFFPGRRHGYFGRIWGKGIRWLLLSLGAGVGPLECSRALYESSGMSCCCRIILSESKPFGGRCRHVTTWSLVAKRNAIRAVRWASHTCTATYSLVRSFPRSPLTSYFAFRIATVFKRLPDLSWSTQSNRKLFPIAIYGTAWCMGLSS